MTLQHFIFSERPKVRLQRHVTFWLFWWLYFGTMHAVLPFHKELTYFQKLPYTISESILFLIPHMTLVYPMLYFVLPRFLLKNRYGPAIFWTIIFVLVQGVVNSLMLDYVNTQLLTALLPPEYLPNNPRPEEVKFAMKVIAAMKGGLICVAIAVGIKFIKHWYLKEQRNVQLLREKTEAQLQLLTAQVHPHFLFNTLNNIYSQTQTESPKGSQMIMQLSDLLRFILSEGNKPVVTLKKELQMLQDYINLEKVRYGNKLELHVSLPDTTGNLVIAPLLLLPLMENSFKHGASKFLRHPWINLTIRLNRNKLEMKLMNGKESHHVEGSNSLGIGISNVKRRLELLYPEQHSLQITDEPDLFVVNLKVNLAEGQPEEDVMAQSVPTLDYA